jgi:3-oxoacyl-[acyl-carrier-protein] synthase-3
MGVLGVSDGAAAAFDVNATCLSFLSALDVAAAKIALGQCRRVLIFSSEIASRALPWATQPDVAALFGDGAAAVIVEAPNHKGPMICASLMETYPSDYDACQIGSGGTRFDYQNEPALFSKHSQFQMDGRRLFRLAHKRFPAFIQKLLDQAGWSISDVDVIVPHQASPAGLAHLVRTTGLSTDRVINICSTYGNQIAASIPTALDIGARDERIKRGSKVLMLGTSAGVSFGGIALEY